MAVALFNGATGTLASEVFAISNAPAASTNPIAWWWEKPISTSLVYSSNAASLLHKTARPIKPCVTDRGAARYSPRYAAPLKSFAHTQTCCCGPRGTLRTIGGARRTNYRDQHLIVIATDCPFSAHDPQACAACASCGTHRPWCTLIAFWSRRTLITFCSFFAGRPRLTLRSLWSRTCNE